MLSVSSAAKYGESIQQFVISRSGRNSIGSPRCVKYNYFPLTRACGEVEEVQRRESLQYLGRRTERTTRKNERGVFYWLWKAIFTQK